MVKNTGITLNGMKVYEDPYMEDDKVLVSRQGNNKTTGMVDIQKNIKELVNDEVSSDVLKNIQKAANAISKAQTASANFMITSSKVAEALEEISERAKRKAKRKSLNKKLNKIKDK